MSQDDTNDYKAYLYSVPAARELSQYTLVKAVSGHAPEYARELSLIDILYQRPDENLIEFRVRVEREISTYSNAFYHIT